jgi:hypothetical protein
MNNEPVAYINVEKRKLEWAEPITWHTPTIAKMDKIPLYTHPVKELTDFEIKGVMALDECWIGEDCSTPNMIAFARAILRKAQEK